MFNYAEGPNPHDLERLQSADENRIIVKLQRIITEESLTEHDDVTTSRKLQSFVHKFQSERFGLTRLINQINNLGLNLKIRRKIIAELIMYLIEYANPDPTVSNHTIKLVKAALNWETGNQVVYADYIAKLVKLGDLEDSPKPSISTKFFTRALNLLVIQVCKPQKAKQPPASKKIKPKHNP